MSSLAWDRFGQHMLTPRLHGMRLFNTSRGTFCVFGGMKWILSTHVEMHFVSSLAWEGFNHHMLICIF